VNPRNLFFAGTVLLGLVADQGTKAWVVATLVPGLDEVQIIPSWFSFVHARNPGAAFSMFEGQRALFLVVTLIAIPVLLDLVRRQERTARFLPLTLGLAFAGVVGNGIDRLARGGEVVDFLKVYAGREPLQSWFVHNVGTYVWPIFNVADSMLVVGVTLFLSYWLFERESDSAPDDEELPASG
jgi:signal peptidase II